MVRALPLISILSGALGCALDLSGAPCADATYCPRGQHCGAGGRCQLGTPPGIERIEIVPANPTLARGSARALKAIAWLAGGATRDVTALAIWTSSNPGIATLSGGGEQRLLTGLAEGKTELAARLEQVVGRTEATITAPALTQIALLPKNPSVPKGSTVQLYAQGTYSDQGTVELTSLVTWTSSNQDVALVSNGFGTRGQLAGVEKGAVEIQASHEGIIGKMVVFVEGPILLSVAITPTQPSIAVSTTQQFIATGTYSDKSTSDLSSAASWASSNPAVATISNTSGSLGLATALAQGATTITATLGSISGSTVLVATAATLSSLAISPTNPTRAKGTTQQLVATATFSDGSSQTVTSQVSWASSLVAVATVSNTGDSRGLVSTLSPGTTAISAALGGISASTQLTVTSATLASIAISPTNPSIAKGTSRGLSATATFSDSSVQDVTFSASWQSSSPGVATVGDGAGSKGVVSGISTGTARISAAVSSVSGSTDLAVTGATLTSLAVTPTNPTIGKGTTLAFATTGIYSDNTTQDLTAAATWSSGNPSVLTISNASGSKGLGTGVSPGTAGVSATVGPVVGSTGATVSGAMLSAIAITPSSSSIAEGTTILLTATATYSDATSQDVTGQVTWSSSNQAVATVSNASGSQGLVATLEAGTTTITATLGPVSGTAALTVTASTLTGIAVLPVNPNVAKGSSRQFSAVGSYSDGSSQDLTAQVSWSSSVTSVATISNAIASKGLANALTAGGTTIVASFGGLSGSTPMAVTNASLTSIGITPLNPTIPRYGVQQFIATGNYSDGSSQPLTSQVTWTSSNTAVATISNATNSKGRASALAPGNTVISATLFSASAQTSLTVAP